MSHNLGGMTQNNNPSTGPPPPATDLNGRPYHHGRLGGMCPPDFKPPDQAAVPSAPNPKKRRKTSNSNANAAAQAPPPPQQDLLPPPLTGYGDTIVASNPFDDAPSPSPTGSVHNDQVISY